MNRTIEDEADDMIRDLENTIYELKSIANGKNYSEAEAKDKLHGIKLSLDYT
jgi:hypothetical protein